MSKSLHMEGITCTDLIATAFNRHRLKGRTRVVRLECGHAAITAAFGRCICLRCVEMFKRSVADGSEDWDAFRHMGGLDDMAWKGDPCRVLNEPHDLVGNPKREDNWRFPNGR